MNIIYVDDEQIQRENFRLTVKGMKGMESLKPVSYTHLTLPTNRDV